MNRFNFYKGLYEAENNRRLELNESLNIPLTVIAIVGAGIYTFITNFKYTEWNTNTLLFLIFGAISVLSMIFCIYYLIRVYALTFTAASRYRILEYADDLEEYYLQLETYYQNLPNSTQNAAILFFESFLIGRYALYSGANARINNTKFALLNKAKEFLVLSLVFLIFVFVPFLINYFYHLN